MIHRFDGSRWLPGPDQRDGSRPFPAHPAPGVFFNDVTGAEGPSADAVAEDLPQLLMKQGALADLLPVPFDWSGLMNRIRTQMTLRGHGEGLSRLMAEARLGPDGSLAVTPCERWPAGIAREAAELALALVRANGQLAYIRAQDWYPSGRYDVFLVIETELNRHPGDLAWHKDTGGDVLFSNLVFRGAEGLPATEWTPDLQPMPADKRALLAGHWPPALLAAIDEARQHLQATGPAPTIEGGTLPADGVVSWVDELVWHSTPMLEHRARWSPAGVAATLRQAGFDADTYDLMAQMVQAPGSQLARWLANEGIVPEAFGIDVASRLWAQAHGDAASQALLDALQQDARNIDWSSRPKGSSYGVSLTLEQPGDDDQRVTSQPTGIAARPRSNSDQMDALQSSEAAEQRRDFVQVIVAVRPST